ncbi:HAMP domain-containing histidine kinase [Paenibacillus sp. N1-5-1-14]|uniref:sensor histidine kinase n=1 Tax=Paenibacillus radicibacter TaxID=2972488 RepID=UPI002158D17C|nr:HAMP domain-containing sensor histidine kinase [Paenibacillus radicibacter]MCR8644924.1 HAMP domain-containing histidine kinase [Paenibacillus radicibacter]
MKLKKKYQLLLLSAVVSVPLLLLSIGVLTSVIYNLYFKSQNNDIPFHASFAYPAMLVVFGLSLLLLSVLFSRSISALLNQINLLNRTIRNLASHEKIPNKINIHSDDEMGALIRSVNLLIDRTTYRELELKQQQDMQKELLQKLRHDISTPLTAVRLQLFDMEAQHECQCTNIESLSQQIQYIAELTKEIHIQSTETLDSSYILSENMNVLDVLETVVRKWGYLYNMNEIELHFHPVDKTLIWNCNVLWTQRLFDNILQNTLRHSKATMLDVVIEHGVVSIRDNGIGFDKNNHPKGLGLKIIEDIARLFQIEYTLKSNEHGTLFRLQQ